jgi:hypothetical protein
MLQDFDSVWEYLKKYDVRFETDSVLKSNLKPYINAEIFLMHQNCTLLSSRWTPCVGWICWRNVWAIDG